jgi:hypothetical protein
LEGPLLRNGVSRLALDTALDQEIAGQQDKGC